MYCPQEPAVGDEADDNATSSAQQVMHAQQDVT